MDGVSTVDHAVALVTMFIVVDTAHLGYKFAAQNFRMEQCCQYNGSPEMSRLLVMQPRPHPGHSQHTTRSASLAVAPDADRRPLFPSVALLQATPLAEVASLFGTHASEGPAKPYKLRYYDLGAAVSFRTRGRDTLTPEERHWPVAPLFKARLSIASEGPGSAATC